MSDLAPLLNALGPANSWARLESARWNGPDCLLVFSVDDGRNEPSRSRWVVTCHGVVAYRIEDVNGGGLNHDTKDHPVARQFSAPRARLLLRGAAGNPDAALASLWCIHRSVADDWIEFDRYLVLDPEYRRISANRTGDEPFDNWYLYDMEPDLGEILEHGTGILAEGPEFLLRAYEEALNECGVACAVEPWKPAPDDNNAGLPGKELEMVHFGSSHFVARAFSCERHDGIDNGAQP